MPRPLLLPLAFAATLVSCSDSKKEVDQTTDAITVEVVAARRDAIRTWTFAEGTARATRREYLTFEHPGRISYLKPGLREGDRVTGGEMLVQQDQRRIKAEIETAQAKVIEAETARSVTEAELVQAETDEKLARTTFERFAILLQKKSASLQEYDETKAKLDKSTAAVSRAHSQLLASAARVTVAEASLAQANLALEETELRAPIDGIVARLNVLEGFYMMPSLVRTDSEEAFLSTVPLVILDPDSLEITVDLPPMLSAGIVPGLETFIQPGGGSDAPRGISPEQFPVRGEVYSVTPSVSPGKRAIQIKIRTTTGAEELQDGMFASVWIGSPKREDALVAPLGVFIYRDNKPFVFVVDPKTSRVQLRAVTLGLAGIDQQEILSGIQPGDLLVTTGRYQLSAGAPVRTLRADPSIR